MYQFLHFKTNISITHTDTHTQHKYRIDFCALPDVLFDYYLFPPI